MRWAEGALFLTPALLFLLWRAAARRGAEGPPARQLLAILAGLLLFGAALAAFAVRERLPQGRYVPAAVVGRRIVPGHAE